mmetsp:Transcript_91953/g.297557  ORF Transcript_91953/g.297557 Transcript_91953/m.297557 type:complete len:342 (+) Transcript_91953:194-1219(+)
MTALWHWEMRRSRKMSPAPNWPTDRSSATGLSRNACRRAASHAPMPQARRLRSGLTMATCSTLAATLKFGLSGTFGEALLLDRRRLELSLMCRRAKLRKLAKVNSSPLERPAVKWRFRATWNSTDSRHSADASFVSTAGRLSLLSSSVARPTSSAVAFRRPARALSSSTLSRQLWLSPMLLWLRPVPVPCADKRPSWLIRPTTLPPRTLRRGGGTLGVAGVASARSVADIAPLAPLAIAVAAALAIDSVGTGGGGTKERGTCGGTTACSDPSESSSSSEDIDEEEPDADSWPDAAKGADGGAMASSCKSTSCSSHASRADATSSPVTHTESAGSCSACWRQ